MRQCKQNKQGRKAYPVLAGDQRKTSKAIGSGFASTPIAVARMIIFCHNFSGRSGLHGAVENDADRSQATPEQNIRGTSFLDILLIHTPHQARYVSLVLTLWRCDRTGDGSGAY